MLPPAQADVTGGGLLAIAVTLLVAWLFYAVTLHLAAVFFIGDVPSQRAAKASVAPVVVSLLLEQYGLGETALVAPGADLLIAALATLVADAVAISYSYRLSWPPTVVLTLLHFAFATMLGFALNNIFGFV
jgi:hypothetical protein